MKTRACIFAAAAFLMLACTGKTVVPDIPAAPDGPAESVEQGTATVITAGLPETTRTALGAKEGSAWANQWSAGDAIFVNGASSEPLGAEQEGSTTAIFIVNDVQAPYNAGYPAAAFSNYADGKATVRIAPEQQYVPGSYDPAAFVMMATGEDNNVSFAAAVSLFRLTVDCDPSELMQSVKFSCRSVNMAVSGTFTTDFKTLKATGGYRNYVTVSSVDGIPGGEPITFVIAPCNFMADGISVEITFKDGRKVVHTGNVSKAYKAGMMYSATLTPANPEPAVIKVAYYNILRPEKRTEEALSMDNSSTRTALGNAIRKTGADIIGFGELDKSTRPGASNDLSEIAAPTDYTWSLNWPNDISRYYWRGWNYSATCDYSNGFAYKSSILRLDESGYVWLQKGGTDSYAEARYAYEKAGSPERTVVWARFTHIQSGTVFWFFVTHLPTSSQGGGENMAGGINNFISWKSEGAPSILVGDMNSADSDQEGSNSGPISILLQEWTDAYDSAAKVGGIGDCSTYVGTLSGSSNSYYYTWQTFTKNYPKRRIDHIMTRGALRATQYSTVRTTYRYGDQVWCPSDHLPVVATIEFD